MLPRSLSARVIICACHRKVKRFFYFFAVLSKKKGDLLFISQKTPEKHLFFVFFFPFLLHFPLDFSSPLWYDFSVGVWGLCHFVPPISATDGFSRIPRGNRGPIAAFAVHAVRLGTLFLLNRRSVFPAGTDPACIKAMLRFATKKQTAFRVIAVW